MLEYCQKIVVKFEFCFYQVFVVQDFGFWKVMILIYSLFIGFGGFCFIGGNSNVW